MHSTDAAAIKRVAIRYENHGAYEWLWQHAPCHWRGAVDLQFTTVPLCRIERADSGTDAGTVSKWLARMQSGRAVPPPVVCRTEHDYFYVHDGNHRCAAMHELFGGDGSADVRVAAVTPNAGFQFRYRWFSTYGTYVLEPVTPVSQNRARVVPADAHAMFPGRTMVLVAHPDDETACAGLLHRLADCFVVFATDGAPAERYFWNPYGSQQNYADVRRAEAIATAALTPAAAVVFLSDHAARVRLMDQQVYRALPDAFAILSGLIRRYQPERLLVPAYEGGHPDHDACSALGALCGEQFGIPVWEMPLYHRSPAGALVCQLFRERNGAEVMLVLSPRERRSRAAMISSYASQNDLGQYVTAKAEYYRPQSAYDYSLPPHPGALNYEAWQWPISAAEVCESLAAGATWPAKERDDAMFLGQRTAPQFEPAAQPR